MKHALLIAMILMCACSSHDEPRGFDVVCPVFHRDSQHFDYRKMKTMREYKCLTCDQIHKTSEGVIAGRSVSAHVQGQKASRNTAIRTSILSIITLIVIGVL